MSNRTRGLAITCAGIALLFAVVFASKELQKFFAVRPAYASIKIETVCDTVVWQQYVGDVSRMVPGYSDHDDMLYQLKSGRYIGLTILRDSAGPVNGRPYLFVTKRLGLPVPSFMPVKDCTQANATPFWYSPDPLVHRSP